MPVVVGGIIPEADVAPLKAAGVAAVYTPKDFDISRIMRDVVALVAARNGAGAAAEDLGGRPARRAVRLPAPRLALACPRAWPFPTARRWDAGSASATSAPRPRS